MTVVVTLIGALIVAAGFVAAVAPSVFDTSLAWVSKGSRVYLAGVVRLLLGGALIAAADGTRLPRVTLAIGIIAIAAGLLVFLIGAERMKRIIAWWLAQPPAVSRAVSPIAIALGAFLIWLAI